jgi:hypothetical protein
VKLPRIKLSTVLFAALRVYLLLILLVYFFQDRLLFFPRDHEFKDCRLAKADGFEPVENSSGHTRIRYWRRRTENAKAWLVHFHGNGGSACESLLAAEKLMDLPLAFALVEYPGYESDGEITSQESLLENGLAAFDLIQGDKPSLPVFLFGESLGTGVATYVASKRKTQGLVLQSPYTSTLEVGRQRYPYFPVRYLMHNTFPASEWAPMVKAPVLVLHGSDDRTIPFLFGEAQSKNFRNLSRFVRLEGVGHNDIAEGDPGRFWGEISAFIQQLLRPQF